MSKSTDPNKLFEKASRETNSEITYWGEVPNSFLQGVKMGVANFQPNKNKGTEKLDKLKDILIEYHKELGILTPKVKSNIDLISEGSVLMGQQPVVFGGPGFIGNKLGCLVLLDGLLRKNNRPLAPVFFIGDYDGLQKELARQYYPNPISHNALILDSEDHLPEETTIAAHAALSPPVEWLEQYLDKIEENLHAFKNQVKGKAKTLLDERWDHIKTILKSTLMKSKTLSDWGAMIWGYLTNIVADHGIVFLPTSHPEIRELVATEYTRFIDNRKKYADTFQAVMDEIQEMGYEPSLPHRHDDYAPFTLECENDNNRITTTIVEKENRIFAEGECPECKDVKSYDVTNEDNLKEIAKIIGPRVDTSQAIFQDLMNIRIRISGPGEIAYYAQAAPAVKSVGFDLPIFIKYKRAFYNNPWIEKLGKQLKSRNQGSLHQGDLFKILRERMDAEKEENTNGIREAEENMTSFIKNQYETLLSNTQSTDVETYLGWQFGRFSKEKFAQEVSWVWFDMALQTGVGDYISTYNRMYLPESSLGGYYFINCLL